MQRGACHEALKPLTWLIGKWRSTNGKGFYPTIKPFNFCDEISFESIGQPILNYSSVTWDPVTLAPIHLERGFLRIKPGTNQVAFMLAQALGCTTLEEGVVCDNEVKCTSTQVSSMNFIRDPPAVSIERLIKLNDNGTLEITISMATTRTSLSPHSRAVYEKL